MYRERERAIKMGEQTNTKMSKEEKRKEEKEDDDVQKKILRKNRRYIRKIAEIGASQQHHLSRDSKRI